MATNPYVGSSWRHWDLHVHSPASYEHEFPGANADAQWKGYLDAMSQLEGVSVLGITDYFTIDGYLRVQEAVARKALPGILLVLPNIELRVDVSTRENKPVNIHVLPDPEILASPLTRTDPPMLARSDPV